MYIYLRPKRISAANILFSFDRYLSSWSLLKDMISKSPILRYICDSTDLTFLFLSTQWKYVSSHEENVILKRSVKNSKYLLIIRHKNTQNIIMNNYKYLNMIHTSISSVKSKYLCMVMCIHVVLLWDVITNQHITYHSHV